MGTSSLGRSLITQPDGRPSLYEGLPVQGVPPALACLGTRSQSHAPPPVSDDSEPGGQGRGSRGELTAKAPSPGRAAALGSASDTRLCSPRSGHRATLFLAPGRQACSAVVFQTSDGAAAPAAAAGVSGEKNLGRR